MRRTLMLLLALLVTGGVAWAALSGPTEVRQGPPRIVKWEELASNTGTAFTLPSTCNRLLVHHFGNFGGVLHYQASNDGTRFDTAMKADGLMATTAMSGFLEIAPCPYQIRPASSSNVDVDVYLIVR